MTTAYFTGEYPQRIDGKGRMSIPADFRRVIEREDPDWVESRLNAAAPEGRNPRLRLLFGDHLKGHLEVWTMSAFAVIAEKVTSARPTTAEAAKELNFLRRIYLTQSLEMEVDRDGRIVMPLRQRTQVGLADGGDVVFAGMGPKFEIWPAEAYQTEVLGEVQSFLDAQPDDYDPQTALWSL